MGQGLKDDCKLAVFESILTQGQRRKLIREDDDCFCERLTDALADGVILKLELAISDLEKYWQSYDMALLALCEELEKRVAFTCSAD